MIKEKVVVAMSGGVDSSVAAAFLLEQGYEVIGMTLQFFNSRSGSAKCCGFDASVSTAKRVCGKLGIRHYVKNAASVFSRHVIDDFTVKYLPGMTPNPCVECNRTLKFSYLFAIVKEMGARFLATGHYAMIDRDKAGNYRLLRAADESRDQSYFLYAVDKTVLDSVIFPLGEKRKTEVRSIAVKLGLESAGLPESRGICFMNSKKYADFIASRIKCVSAGNPFRGSFVDTDGRRIGRHDGIFRYTVGQRHGLGVCGPSPHYVVSIVPQENKVVVGSRSQACSRACSVLNINWLTGRRPDYGGKIEAQIRYRHKPACARFYPAEDETARLEFEEPQFAVSPGQSAVFYNGSHVLGGGIIKK